MTACPVPAAEPAQAETPKEPARQLGFVEPTDPQLPRPRAGGSLGLKPLNAEEKRFRYELRWLPVIQDRPTGEGDCAPCPRCQKWRDAQAKKPSAQVRRLRCGHWTSEAMSRSRPCVLISCKKNTYSDRSPSGALILNFPDLEPHQMDPKRSCSVDVAMRGGATLEEVGKALGLTMERIRQIEKTALAKIEQSSLGREVGGHRPRRRPDI